MARKQTKKPKPRNESHIMIQSIDSSDTSPGGAPQRITRTPGVCGGDPVVAGTRIPVWVLEQCRHLRMSTSEILEDYPSLTEADLIAAWSYAENHRDEIEQQICENSG